MSEPFIGEIRMFGGNFAPSGWQFCQGQLLNISTNTALFSLLGTTYGGNGQTTFALPDLRGRVPVGTGQGPGLAPVVQGETAGAPSTTLTIPNLPPHVHQATFNPNNSGSGVSVTLQVAAGTGGTATATEGCYLGSSPTAGQQQAGVFYASTPTPTNLVNLGGLSVTAPTGGGTVALAATGGGMPIDIRQPYTGINFIIALEGIFPSRN